MSWEGRQISTKAQYSEQRRQLGRFLLSVPGEAHLDAEQGKHLTLCSLYSICACICAICLNTLYYQRRETDVSRTWLISSQFSKNRTRWFMTWTLPFPLEQGAQAASLDQVSQLGTSFSNLVLQNCLLFNEICGENWAMSTLAGATGQSAWFKCVQCPF